MRRSSRLEKLYFSRQTHTTATLQELGERVYDETNEHFSISTLKNLLRKRKINRKKITIHAAEQDRRDVRIK